jgi:alpha 1,6-mannosyltransferase
MTSGKSTPTRDHAKAVEDTNIDGTLTSSWYPVDGAWKYNFVGTQAGEDFVREHFKDQPDVIEAFTSLTLPVMRSDFLRYLLLAGAGGYYADSDVQLVKPLSQWMPQEFKNKAHAVIGIEIDYGSNDSPDWRMLQFCQYTMATTKGHPIMAKMARNITDSLLERAKNGTVADLDQELHDKDVMTITGPTAFKQIVFDHLSEQVGEPVSWRNVSDLPAPKLFGDTLILPINYFGAGQRHSGSDENSTDKLVQHMWKGTWRHWNESVY